MEELAYRLNFSLELLFSDLNWGSAIENGTRISGLCGHVHEGRADFGFAGLSMKEDRLQFVDMVWIYPIEGTIITTLPQPNWPPWIIVNIWPEGTWALVFVSVSLMSLIACLDSILFQVQKNLTALNITGNYIKCWIEVVKYLLSQGFDLRFTGSVAYGWLISSLYLYILSELYSSEFTAQLALVDSDPMNTMDKLCQRLIDKTAAVHICTGWWWWPYFKEEAEKRPLGQSEQTHDSIIGHYMMPGGIPGTDEFFENAKHYGKLGQAYVEMLSADRAKVLERTYPEHVYAADDEIHLFPTGAGIAVRYGSTLKNIFTSTVYRFYGAGLMECWVEMALRNSPAGKQMEQDGEDDDGEMDQMKVFHLTSIGIVCSMLVLAAAVQLVGETLWRRQSRAQKWAVQLHDEVKNSPGFFGVKHADPRSQFNRDYLEYNQARFPFSN